MKRLRNTLIFLFLALGVLYAQQMNADQVRQNIDQLQRKIGQVSALAKKYNDARAIKLVDKATAELAFAYKKYQEYKNTPEGQITRRKLLINLAKGHFKLAEKYIGVASKLLLFKPAAQKKNELNNLIRKAQDAVNRSQSDESRYFLNKARRFQSEAQSAFRRQRFLRGYEFLRVAMYFAQKTIEMSSISGQGSTGEQDFQNARQNIRMLMQRAGDLIAQNSLAAQMYHSAEDYFKKARNAYRSGHLKQAFSQLKLAERLLFRVVDMSDKRSTSSKQQAMDNLQSLGRYLQSLQNDFQEAANPFLNKAYKLYQRARRQVRNGKYRQALVSVQLSQRMALKAYHQNSTPAIDVNKEQLENRYRDTRQLYELQDAAMKDAAYSLQIIHLQAGKYLNKTEKALQNKAFFRAEYLMNIAIKLMNRARLTGLPDISRQQVEKNINRLSDALNRLQNNSSLDEKWRVRGKVLLDLLTQAQNAFQRDEIAAAANLAGFVENQLTALLKRN